MNVGRLSTWTLVMGPERLTEPNLKEANVLFKIQSKIPVNLSTTRKELTGKR